MGWTPVLRLLDASSGPAQPSSGAPPPVELLNTTGEPGALAVLDGEHPAGDVHDVQRVGRDRFLVTDPATGRPGGRGGIRVGRPTYTKNDDYFTIDDVESAYWAGFIAADGHVSDKPARLTLELSVTDVDHLQQFVRDTAFTGPITQRTRTRASGKSVATCRVQISSAYPWVRDLWRRYSITPHKSWTLEPPSVTGDQRLAFVIGLLDGNGTVSFDRKGRSIALRLTLTTASAALARWVEEVFGELSGSPGQRFVYRQGAVHRVVATGRRAVAIVRALAVINVPRLRRKWDRAAAVIETDTASPLPGCSATAIRD